MERDTAIHDLLDRLARLHAAGLRSADLNPPQAAALSYLARANRFSRSPSHVADYLSATRGTVSQTLKTLARKGYVAEHPRPEDRRSVSYSVTGKGAAELARDPDLLDALARLDDTAKADLARGAEALLLGLIARSGARGFGLCRTCRHHRVTGDARHCALLDVPLAAQEADQICHEHAA